MTREGESVREVLGLSGDELRFRELLRWHRLRTGLTQEALAERAGLSPRGVSDLERGARRRARRDTLRRLADALQLGIEERAALLSAAQRARATGRAHVPEARSALPLPVTSFIGRDVELEDIARLVRTARLVSLVGPGGVGKTRLAQEVARRMRDGQGPEVVWVDLTSTRDPHLALALIAEALDVRDLGGRGLHEALVHALKNRQLLLLLDNMEHVLDAAAEVAALLRACLELRIVATSREPLRLQSERVYTVAPLGLPADAELADPERAARAPAVALFVERAQAANPSFRMDATSIGAVVELCRRLDGLPLAIELAAARSRALQPGVLLDRDGLLDLLRGLRDHPDRHASLRTVLDWSFHLLSAPEQVLLHRLAVFAGGCTLEAAEAVCHEGLAPEGVVDLLGRLVDRSLVVVEPGPSCSRYRLLETVRAYAAERLEVSGERETLRRQHALWCLALAEEAAPHIWRPETAVWLERLEQDHENLRTALAWSVHAAPCDEPNESPTRAEVGLRLGAALMLFWDLRGALREGRTWLDRLLALRGTTPAPDAAWVGASYAAGYVTLTQGDYEEGIVRLKTTRTWARIAAEPALEAEALMALGAIGVLQGCDPSQVRELLREALQIGEDTRDTYARAASRYWLAESARLDGDFATAQALLLECLSITRQVENISGTAYVLASLGRIALAEADTSQARAYQQESLALRRDLDDRRGIALCLEELAWVAGFDGRAEEAARLFGASAALHDELGLPLVPVPEWRTWHQRAEAAARELSGQAGYAAAWEAGRALPRPEAIAVALGTARHPLEPDRLLRGARGPP